MPDLTADEAAELNALERDMADTRGVGAGGRGDWHTSYWHSEAKQARYAELIERRDGAGQEELPGPPTEGADPRLAKIMQDPNYWKDPKLQEQARRFLEGEVVAERMDTTREHAETLATWSETLNSTPEDCQAMLDRADAICQEIDTTDMDLSFEAMNERTQLWAYKILAEPHNRVAILEAMDDASYEEFATWVEGLQPHEHAAVEKALGLRV